MRLTKKQNDERIRSNARNDEIWKRDWLAEHPWSTSAEYGRQVVRGDSEVWDWRRAKGKATLTAEKAAWLEDHPCNPLPEHQCEWSETMSADYAAWENSAKLG